MQRQGVVDGAIHASGPEELGQPVAARSADGVLVIDVPEPRQRGMAAVGGRGCRDLVVSLGDPDALLDPALQMGKFHLEDGRLQGIQPAVEAGTFMPVAGFRPMQADHAASSGQVGIVWSEALLRLHKRPGAWRDRS